MAKYIQIYENLIIKKKKNALKLDTTKTGPNGINEMVYHDVIMILIIKVIVETKKTVF